MLVSTEEGKVCSGKCGQFKPYSEFHKDRTQKDGYKKICKPCRSEVQKEYRSSKTDQNDEAQLQSEARRMALKRLVDIHKREYLVLLEKAKNEVGLKPKWIQIR